MTLLWRQIGDFRLKYSSHDSVFWVTPFFGICSVTPMAAGQTSTPILRSSINPAPATNGSNGATDDNMHQVNLSSPPPTMNNAEATNSAAKNAFSPNTPIMSQVKGGSQIATASKGNSRSRKL